jgi:hypothetical protein
MFWLVLVAIALMTAGLSGVGRSLGGWVAG